MARAFRPQVEDTLTIGGLTYYFTQHPGVRAMRLPYAQAGRKAMVYQLATRPPAEDAVNNPIALGGGADVVANAAAANPQKHISTTERLHALKVFIPEERTPRVEYSAALLRGVATLPGLEVCTRVILTAQQHPELVAEYPDLEYAVLMPWATGTTWHDVISKKIALSEEQSLALGQVFLYILARMEERDIAHCDLSGPNIVVSLHALDHFRGSTSTMGEPLLPRLATPWQSLVPDLPIALVDVEELYAPGMPSPRPSTTASPGYVDRTAHAGAGVWGPLADRFTGAVLIGEMLNWCDQKVRQEAHSEGYFQPRELQQDSPRLQLFTKVLGTRWGSTVATLFDKAWHSSELEQCPTFAEWASALGARVPAKVDDDPLLRFVQAAIEKAGILIEMESYDGAIQELKEAFSLAPHLLHEAYVHGLRVRAHAKEKAGSPTEALDDYRVALAVASQGRLQVELQIITAAIYNLTAKSSRTVQYCPRCRAALQPHWVRCSYCKLDLLGTNEGNTSLV